MVIIAQTKNKLLSLDALFVMMKRLCIQNKIKVLEPVTIKPLPLVV